ncbi:MAG: hypothetical protein ABW133_00725 [Polyangiaceae bacterium]
MPAWALRRNADRATAIAWSSLLFLALASACNRSDREPSPAPSASPAATTPPVPAPTDPVPPPTQPAIDGAQPTKAEGPSPLACATDADCRAFSDSCTICSCRPLGKNAPDPKCNGKTANCLIDPCTGLRAFCRKGSCMVGDPGDGSSGGGASSSDAAVKDVASGKDATSDSAVVKSADAASSTKSDGAAAPSSSAPPKAPDAAAH